jgi:hypothetical protein
LLFLWCISIFFFLLLTPSSTTESGKMARMVAHDVVHDEFEGAPAKSTQIRTPTEGRAQMAVSLAHLFPIAPSRPRSPIESFMLLAHGSCMLSSLNDKYFLFFDFFTPKFWLLTFYFDPLPTLKHLGCYWLRGPICHPPCTINVSFLGFIFNP